MSSLEMCEGSPWRRSILTMMNLFIPQRECVLDGGLKTYLMKDNSNGAIKIGKSKTPGYREDTLMSQNPNITLVAICDNDVEKRLHRMYKHKRMRGEWFSLDESDVYDVITTFDFYTPTKIVDTEFKPNVAKLKKNSTNAIDTIVSLRLDDYCAKMGYGKKEFLAEALVYFERTGINPREENDPLSLSAIKKTQDEIINVMQTIGEIIGETQKTIIARNKISDVRYETIKELITPKKKWWNKIFKI